jgi:hypothetical protein
MIKSLGPSGAWPGKIHKATMLGVDQALKFSRNPDGLKVDMPDRRPGEYATC